MKFCRLIKAVEDAEHARDLRFAVYTLLIFLTIVVSVAAEVWK